ncbi:MAG TPA: head GIN domain-containing protein, partial [Flavisolibacter sp.]|nr:head GIN domain-containing protein [Flavisolibacter sp.]
MRTILLFAAILAFCSSCNMFGGQRVSGNGKITSENRNVSAFTSIDASGSLKVQVRQDSSTAVKIETDENLLEYVEVYVKGNTLVIKSRDGFNLDPSKDLVIYTVAPVYRSIQVSGSGDIISENTISGSEPLEMGVSGSGNINVQVALPRLSAHVSGSGNVLLKGTSKEFSGSVSGSGSIKAFELATDVSTLHISGGADVEITANQKLDVNVSGSADVKYKGNAQVSQSISGSGSV